jgi:hypothetical protein
MGQTEILLRMELKIERRRYAQQWLIKQNITKNSSVQISDSS